MNSTRIKSLKGEIYVFEQRLHKLNNKLRELENEDNVDTESSINTTEK